MKIAERIVMLLIVFFLIGGTTWFYFAVQNKHQEVVDAVARGEYEVPLETDNKKSEVSPEDWRVIYPNTVPITVGGVDVYASIADTLPTRIKGLSGTPFLPDNVVKLFAFGVPGNHSIWMKEMNYSIDIIWVAKEGNIVHIEENVSPDTYPESFAPPVEAWYVVEASAGFSASNTIVIGDKVVIPLE
ncbi:DUF192 domain-containing protein [Candidatus Nomurabacteria bacterium]|nr:DUF192 domain-containing protein [Candidatus Kaiserbacteria bacterium]MCB9814853.1 DUF192 domain-containing protein [Candidatus Nomurabacteria bacterium]